MKQNLNEMATVDLAFATGHKLTKIHRANGGPMIGLVYLASLDGNKLQRLTEIRHRLEAEYLALEATQGTPKL